MRGVTDMVSHHHGARHRSAFKHAGADGVLTYFVPCAAEKVRKVLSVPEPVLPHTSFVAQQTTKRQQGG
jgi:hypothetical protein